MPRSEKQQPFSRDDKHRRPIEQQCTIKAESFVLQRCNSETSHLDRIQTVHIKRYIHIIMSIITIMLFVLCSRQGLTSPLSLQANSPLSLHANNVTETTDTDRLRHTVAAINTLDQWYSTDTGLWSSGWWTSANQLTTVADFAAIDPDFILTLDQVFENTFAKASSHKVAQVKVNNATMVNTWSGLTIPAGLAAPPPGSSGDWLNYFYDDEGWWALAWLKVYDLTNEACYLNAAMDIFEDMTKGWGATCGGIWWNKGHKANVAISNELFLAIASQLATRAPNKEAQAEYLQWALKSWRWFYNSGLINADYNINDGLNLETCKNNNGIVWSYNQGVILGALVELNKAQPSNIYLETASKIATAALKKLSVDGILHEPCEPDCGNDGPQFKGIFMRGLQALQQASPDPAFAKFIQQNADSIWDRARGDGNKLGLVWSGPYKAATAATQSSALDTMVAAVIISGVEVAASSVAGV